MQLLESEHEPKISGRLVVAAAYDIFFAIGDIEKAINLLCEGAKVLGEQQIKDRLAIQIYFRLNVNGQLYEDQEPFLKSAKEAGYDMWEAKV